VRKSYKTFHIDDIIIPKRLKKQGKTLMFIRFRDFAPCLQISCIVTGLDDPKLLPKFYYRDDILDLWDLMRSYVSSIIQFYYKCDEVQKYSPC